MAPGKLIMRECRRRSGLLGVTGLLARSPCNPGDGWAGDVRE
jgi:hypothetical protein